MRHQTSLRNVASGIIVIAVVAFIFVAPTAVNNLRYGDFLIAGTVVDEEGMPVEDFTVSVIGSRRIKGGFDSEHHQRYVKASRAFRFEEDNYSNITLLFLKTGFQYETLEFRTAGKNVGIRVVLKRGSGPASRPVTPLRRALSRESGG